MSEETQLIGLILLLLCLTYLVASIEVAHESKSTLIDSFSGTLLILGLLLFLLNGIGAVVLNSVFLEPRLPSQLTEWSPVFSVLLACLALQGLVKHMNVTFFSDVSLDIEGWIGKIQDLASTAAVRKKTSREKRSAQKLAQGLSATLTVREMNTYVLQHLGQHVPVELDQVANADNSDAQLLKALARKSVV